MAQQINENLQNNTPKPLDAKYSKFVSGSSVPYTSVAEACSSISISYRSIGLTVIIRVNGDNREYWWKEALDDGSLIQKTVIPLIVKTNGVVNSSQAVLNIADGANSYVTESNGLVQVNVAPASSSGSSETIIAPGGIFMKAFVSSIILESFLIVPTDSSSYTISVGTTSGGNDIFDSYTVDGNNPPVFSYTKFFKTTQSWYFTGIPIGSTIKFFYK